MATQTIGSGEGRELALVMSGGGARAAYQVGVLCTIASRRPALPLPILTGVSAGAINASYLAAAEGDLRVRIEALAEVWSGLEIERVFRAGSLSLLFQVLHWGVGLLSGGRAFPRRRALVDTAPLGSLLACLLRDSGDGIPGIAANLRCANLRAIAITTSSYSTGQSITWVQGRRIAGWERAHRRSRNCRLTARHVLASAALPLFFPAVEIDGEWFGDGGMRLTAPFSPAIHLGADKIIAISTRYGASRAEADDPVVAGYPPPAQVAGVLLNSIFLDQFDGDALRLNRINDLVEGTPPEQRRGLRRIELLVVRPSMDLGKLANDYEPRLPSGFRFLTRGFGTRQTRSNDLLSLVMFQADYLSRLIELGREDADREWPSIERFLGC